MAHQPFETWLLDEEPLTFDQRRELEAHLQTCSQCQQVSSNWTAVTGLIRTTPLARPAVDFTLRWKAARAERIAHQQPRQVRTFFITLLASSLVSLALLAIFFVISQLTFSDVLVSAAKGVTTLYSLWLDFQAFLTARLTGPLPLVVWILFTTGICILIIIWIVTVLRVTTRGVTHK
jgi:hypothetical protein